MTSSPGGWSGAARWLACGVGCLLALGSVAVLVFVLWSGAGSFLTAWPGKAAKFPTPRPGAAPGGGSDGEAWPVARGDPERLALPLPADGEERSLASLYHRGEAPPLGDDFTFGADEAMRVAAPGRVATPTTPEATPAPGGDLEARLAEARRRRDATFERYTRLVTEGGEGSVPEALREYRAAVEALAALEREAAPRR